MSLPIRFIDLYTLCGTVSVLLATASEQTFTYESSTSKVSGIMNNPSDVRPGETMSLPYSSSRTYQQCLEYCQEQPTCHAFTFFGHDNPDVAWAGQCVGRTDYRNVSEYHYYGTSGERSEESEVSTGGEVSTAGQPQEDLLAYQVVHQGSFYSSDGTSFTTDCTQAYSAEFSEKAITMVPVVNDLIGTRLCQGKTLEEIRIISVSTSFTTSFNQGTTYAYWTMSVGGSQQIGSVEGCATEVAIFLQDHDNWGEPLLPDLPDCPGVIFQADFSITEQKWLCLDTTDVWSIHTEYLLFSAILTGYLRTEDFSSIDPCLVEYTNNLQASTANQITRTNDVMSSLCPGDDIRISTGSATLTSVSYEGWTRQTFALNPGASMSFDEVYTCADRVSAYLQSHDNWEQPIISVPGCPALDFIPPQFGEESQKWLC